VPPLVGAPPLVGIPPLIGAPPELAPPVVIATLPPEPLPLAPSGLEQLHAQATKERQKPAVAQLRGHE
jgi:hypothetical protein